MGLLLSGCPALKPDAPSLCPQCPAAGGNNNHVSAHLSEPDRRLSGPKELLLGYLDFYRSVIASKIAGVPDDQLRASRLPSGWAPLELVNHLVFMERRWLQWGFLAEPVPAPYGDDDDAGRWHVSPNVTTNGLVAALDTVGQRTRVIVTGAELADVSQLGGRFSDGDREPPPTLGWILLHVLQEYARHAGQLDIARELIDGVTGE
jgi:uncharacterized damage-inducible protein DinB